MEIHVLILEDDPKDAGLIDRCLSKANLYHFERSHVATVKDAQELLSTQSFDALLTDLNVSNGYGLNVLGRLHAAAPETPIIVITGSIEGDRLIEDLKDHADGVLFKDGLTAHRLEREIGYFVMRRKYAAALEEIERLKIKPQSGWVKVFRALPDLIVKIIGWIARQNH